MTSRTDKRRRGFLLLEVVLALAVFGIAATGFIVAIHRSADAAMMTQNRMRVTRMLKSALQEAVSLPSLQEGSSSVALLENDTEIITLVEPLENLENDEGVPLQDMYVITVTAYWTENGQRQEQSARTWRNARMYQP
jgi:prepilin-type N-terminal cleavage/methylation domain-containing protein